MNQGKAASTDESILGKSELKTGKFDVCGPLAQPPKCPECTSQKVWKDGVRSTRNGDVQRYLCCSCGYRFSETQVKVDIMAQSSEMPNSRLDLLNGRVVGIDFPIQKLRDDLAFSRGKDVGSHKVTTVGKDLNNLGSYNRNHQVCVSESEAKNLSQQRTRTKKQAAGATKSQQAQKSKAK